MKPTAPPGRQRGVALWMLLILIATGAGYLFLRSNHLEFSATRQRTEVANTLARAKEALIAYAVTDADQPGSLPCPDLITNSAGLSNVPGDGKTDFFTTNICPSYVGWLPWITLKLPELTDDTGTRLWYVLAPNLRNHSSAQPINSDTTTGLSVDGNTDIAALIIAPRSPIGSQSRPSNDPSDYLDGENGNGNDHVYISGPKSDTFNDEVLIITRQELMAAVEKRVANELRNCLDQHAQSSANTEQRFPWAAPITSTAFQGKSGTLFGRVPLTQPSSGPSASNKSTITTLTQLLSQLSSASDANSQLTLLKALAEALAAARNRLDALFTSANSLKQYADAVIGLLDSVESSITSATANNRISRSEGSSIRTLSGSDNDSTLTTLLSALSELGFDPFPWQLQQYRSTLASISSATSLLTVSQNIVDLLGSTTTARTDITPALAAALSAASASETAAALAAAAPRNSTLLSQALSAASTLASTLQTLQSAVEASRVSMLSADVATLADSLASLNTAMSTSASSDNLRALQSALSNTLTTLNSVTTGVTTVSSALSSAISSVSAANSATQSTSPDYAAISSATTRATSSLLALSSAIAANEAVDNNISHTSLAANIAAYQTARDTFASIDTKTPRPNQRTITPYATAISSAAVYIEIWAKMVSDNAALVAAAAKANTVSSGTDASTATVLASSAYQAAVNALSSISDSGGAIALLEAYLASPSQSKQTAAASALAQSVTLINTLLSQLSTLSASLSSTTASASPLAWLSSQCDFLSTSSSTWWSNNGWRTSLFYQLGHILRPNAARLSVNGSGAYRLVVLAAGRPLTALGQAHSTLTVANFLEGLNADISRDGDATAPNTPFVSQLPSATFNDRLAF